MQPDNEFKQHLLAAQDMTYDDLLEAMYQIPSSIKEKLAEGPKSYRYACGVCIAFGREFYENMDHTLDNPMFKVWIYHEIPKVHMRFRDQLHSGQFSNQTYIRCLETYRAAGWLGEFPEANA